MEYITFLFGRIKKSIQSVSKLAIITSLIVLVVLCLYMGFIVYHFILPTNDTVDIGENWMSILDPYKRNESIMKLSFSGTKNSFVLDAYFSAPPPRKWRNISINYQIRMGIRYFEYTMNVSNDTNYFIYMFYFKRMLNDFKRESITHSSEYLLLHINGCANEYNNETISIINSILGYRSVLKNVNGYVRTLNDITLNTMTPGRNILTFYSAACGVDVDLGDSIWSGSALMDSNVIDVNTAGNNHFNVHNITIEGPKMVYEKRDRWLTRMFSTDSSMFDRACTSSTYSIGSNGCIGIYSIVDPDAFKYAYMKNF